ncbi:MAG: hypothetical protein WBW73_08830 [Rhodoplanes sp.]
MEDRATVANTAIDGRRSVMRCVLVAEMVDKPQAVSAFPSNGIYLAGHVGILQDRGNRGVLV